jgi:hypothetical protein
MNGGRIGLYLSKDRLAIGLNVGQLGLGGLGKLKPTDHIL